MRAEPALRSDPPSVFSTPAARRFHVVLPGCPSAVRRTLMDARGHCRRAGLSEEDGARIELVLAEVMNNVVEHALRDCPDGVIELELSLREDRAECRVSDDGAAMPQACRPQPGTCAPLGTPTDLPEGGFGWHLICQLSRDVAYERRSGWNRLTLAVQLNQTTGSLT